MGDSVAAHPPPLLPLSSVSCSWGFVAVVPALERAYKLQNVMNWVGAAEEMIVVVWCLNLLADKNHLLSLIFGNITLSTSGAVEWTISYPILITTRIVNTIDTVIIMILPLVVFLNTAAALWTRHKWCGMYYVLCASLNFCSPSFEIKFTVGEIIIIKAFGNQRYPWKQ